MAQLDANSISCIRVKAFIVVVVMVVVVVVSGTDQQVMEDARICANTCGFLFLSIPIACHDAQMKSTAQLSSC